MVRVLHIVPNLGVGGAEKLVLDLLRYRDKLRFDVAVCSLYPKGDTWIERELAKNRIRVFYLNKRLGPDPRVIPGLFRVFKKYRPDVVHTHRYVLRYSLWPALVFNTPVRIHTVHNIAEKEVDLPGRIIHRIAFKFLNVHPIGVSREISKTVSRFYKTNSAPYIYNGVPTDSYHVNGNSRREHQGFLKINDNHFVCLHIGRFSPQKNHKLLVKAFSRVLSEIPDAILIMVGYGELRLEVDRLVRSLGLEDNVRLLGVREDVPDLLAVSDLLVLSSNWEGVPLVVLEAMAAGKPVVATSVGGVPELVVPGETGLLVPPGDEGAFAGAITWVHKNASSAIKMGERGREIVKAKFDTKAMTSKYEELYLNLVGAKSKE